MSKVKMLVTTMMMLLSIITFSNIVSADVQPSGNQSDTEIVFNIDIKDFVDDENSHVERDGDECYLVVKGNKHLISEEDCTYFENENSSDDDSDKDDGDNGSNGSDGNNNSGNNGSDGNNNNGSNDSDGNNGNINNSDSNGSDGNFNGDNDNGSNGSDGNSNDGSALPKTATPIFNIMAIGLSLIALSAILLLVNRRRIAQ